MCFSRFTLHLHYRVDRDSSLSDPINISLSISSSGKMLRQRCRCFDWTIYRVILPVNGIIYINKTVIADCVSWFSTWCNKPVEHYTRYTAVELLAFYEQGLTQIKEESTMSRSGEPCHGRPKVLVQKPRSGGGGGGGGGFGIM